MSLSSLEGPDAARVAGTSEFFLRCPDGALLLGEGGAVLAVNQAILEILRLPEADLLRAGLLPMVAGGDRTRLRRALADAGRKGNLRLDVDCRRGDGSTFVAAVSVAPAAGTARWVTVRDITARRRAEQALESLGELTTDLLDGAPMPELMAKVASGARRMLGAAAAWISTAGEDGQTIQVVAQDYDAPDFPDLTGRHFPLRSVLSGQVALRRRPILIDDLSSEAGGASEVGRSLGFGPAMGVPLGHGSRFFGSLIAAARPGHPGFGPQDVVTAKMVARWAAVALGLATVQGELADLAALYEDSPDAVLLSSESGRVLSANRAAQQMFAMTERELGEAGGVPGSVGTHPAEVLETAYGPLGPAGAGSGGGERTEITYRRPDGTLLIGDVAAVTSGGAYRSARRWTVVRDVTDRRRTEESLRGLTDLTMALLRREPLDGILTRSAAHARRLVDAAAAYAATISRPGETIAVVAEDAPTSYSLLGREKFPWQGVVGRAIDTGESLTVADLWAARARSRASTPPALGPALVVPVIHDERSFGALVVAAERGAPQFGVADLAVVEMFARSAALALDLNSARASLALVEERERIAKNLHDRVIQHLFGTGMGLEAVRGRSVEQMSQAIDRSVEALDSIITEIRSTIFDLTGGPQSGAPPPAGGSGGRWSVS